MSTTNITNVVEFYLVCNKLKDTIRTGWQNWGVNRDRLESVAEHIYGTQMLAIAIHSEFNYQLDLNKILFMLAIHELGEALIGDYTPFEIDQSTKADLELKAVYQVLRPLKNHQQLENLFNEFNDLKTPEAKFAHACDKLECDLQCKLYDEEHAVDLTDQTYPPALQDPIVKELFENGASWSEIWLKFSQRKYSYDPNFQAISDYVISHSLQKPEPEDN